MTNDKDLAALASQFHALFSGMEKAYGTYNNIHPDPGSTKGKLKGDAITERKPVTDKLWELHLSGKLGIGIIPIQEENTACFGAIDIDVYIGLDAPKILADIERLNLPLIPCRSKSGGLHLFLFTGRTVPAAHMQSKLREIAAKLGHGLAEIFPKQTVILAESNDLGSWINMPYFDGDNTERHALRPDGTPMSVTGFLDAAEAVKAIATPEWIARPLPLTLDVLNALPDGPPCLQHLVEQGVSEGGRNKVLFNLGVYCRKANADDWEEPTREMNRLYIRPPLLHDEQERIIKSVEKKDYFYTCNDAPLTQFCDKSVCRTRKYGIGSGGAAGGLVLGSLSKLMTDPPIWFLEVEQGQRVELTTDQLLNPIEFQKRCADALKGVLVPVMKRATWTDYLRPAMENVIEIPAPADMSAGGHLEELLEEFCTDRAQANTWEEILSGMAFTKDGKTYFQLAGFVNHVQRKSKEYKRFTITKWLREFGATDYIREIGGKDKRLWRIDAFSGGDGKPWPVPDSVSRGDAGEF